MEHSPKQSHYVIFPALEMLWNSLCGTRKKKFGNPDLELDYTALTQATPCLLLMKTTNQKKVHFSKLLHAAFRKCVTQAITYAMVWMCEWLCNRDSEKDTAK